MLQERLMMPDKITIIKNDHKGNEVWRYTGRVIDQTDDGLVVEALFNRTDLLFNGVLLKDGDRFIEFYSRKKWFNIYEIYDRDDEQLKAYYCNITRPARWENGCLQYDDLALDLLVYPDGKQLALDEDEFMALNLSDLEVEQARKGMGQLKKLFSSGINVNVRDLIKSD